MSWWYCNYSFEIELTSVAWMDRLLGKYARFETFYYNLTNLFLTSMLHSLYIECL